jgi:hypothetical protein
MKLHNAHGTQINYDHYLSYDPDLEYENDNPADYKVTFTTDDFVLTMNVELDDPTSDIDLNYSIAKQQALYVLEANYGLELLSDIRETVVQVA